MGILICRFKFSLRKCMCICVCYSFKEINCVPVLCFWGFPGGLVVKNPPTNAGDIEDTSLIQGSGRPHGEGNSKPLQYSCLENPWAEQLGGLQSLGSQRVGHSWVTERTLLFPLQDGNDYSNYTLLYLLWISSTHVSDSSANSLNSIFLSSYLYSVFLILYFLLHMYVTGTCNLVLIYNTLFSFSPTSFWAKWVSIMNFPFLLFNSIMKIWTFALWYFLYISLYKWSQYLNLSGLLLSFLLPYAYFDCVCVK